jgi:hypothetical protein
LDAGFRFLVSQYIPALNVKRRQNQPGIGAATHNPLLSSNTGLRLRKPLTQRHPSNAHSVNPDSLKNESASTK